MQETEKNVEQYSQRDLCAMIKYFNPHNIASININDPLQKAKFFKNCDQARRWLDKYKGLCDVICNNITANNLLADGLENKKKLKQLFNTGKTGVRLGTKYNPTNECINCIEGADMQIWDMSYSFYRFLQLLAFHLLNLYPESVCNKSTQKNLFDNDTQKPNYDAIKKICDTMKVGDYYKLCYVRKTRVLNTMLGAHSTLLYKSENKKIISFDPNFGSVTLSLDSLQDFEQTFKNHNDFCRLKIFLTNDSSEKIEFAIIDNKKFLSRHHNNCFNQIQKKVYNSSEITQFA